MADTWYKTEYPYRRKITLTNPDVEVADDSYLIEVDTASLVSAGKCRSDCDDIIFCRADDPAELTRYILPGSENTATTSIYVRIKNLSAGTTYIYMYYGSGVAGANQALVEYYKEMKGSVDVSGMGAGYYRDIYKSVIETPDGVNMVFTVEDGAYLADSLAVYLRGQQLLKDVDFWEATPSSGLFEFATPPYPGDDIWAEYYADSATPYAPATPYWSTFTADTGSVTADSLADSFKFTGSGGISTTISGGKQVIIDLATPSSDELVKVSSNDTTAGYLNGKLLAGDNITLTEGSDGGDETLTIASTASGGAWEVIDTQTVTGSAISRFTFKFDGSKYLTYELKLCIKNDHPTNGTYGLMFFNSIESTVDDETKWKRQKYYATNTTWTLGREKNSFIYGCMNLGECFTVAEFARTGGVDVFSKMECVQTIDAGGYPRAYISFARFINIGTEINRLDIVNYISGGIETAYIYPGSSATLLGLKKVL